MNETRECPKCKGTMNIGFLDGAARWRRGESLLNFQIGPRIFGYACRNCGFVEFYLQQKGETRNEHSVKTNGKEGRNRLVRT